MRLQDVLKEREAEISVLETSLKDKAEPNGHPSSLAAELERSPSLNHNDDYVHLSPKTINHFSEIRKSLDLHHANQYTVSDVDESLGRLNELMMCVTYFELHLAQRALRPYVVQLYGTEGVVPQGGCRRPLDPARPSPEAARGSASALSGPGAQPFRHIDVS